MIRPKSPAYAKSILEARRSGRHPQLLHVVYGHDWDVPEGTRRVAVKPGAALGLDWRCAAAVGVQVLDRSRGAEDNYDAEGNRELFFLLGEIARAAAFVQVETPEALTASDRPAGPGRCYADIYAFLSRKWDRGARRFTWPAWWSEEIENTHAQNRKRWIAEAEQFLARCVARR